MAPTMTRSAVSFNFIRRIGAHWVGIAPQTFQWNRSAVRTKLEAFPLHSCSVRAVRLTPMLCLRLT